MLLAQPGNIGPLRLKNRVVMAPMGTNYSTSDGYSTERDKLYYAERARGGVAMIMTEAMVVTEQARQHNNSLCCYHDRFIPGLASIVEAIKQHDCHVFGQLNHRGALLRRSVLNMEPVGPSPWANPNTGDAVRPLRVPEIIEIQKLFVSAAKRLWQAGYDGVEIHAANGYLFQQFFTSRINKRTDLYGGSIENRMRLLLETVARMRDALPDLLLMVRLSASEFTPDGYTKAEIIQLAQALEHAGVIALDLSGGSNESPQLSKYCIQPPSFARGCLAPYAKPIKDSVSIPVLVAGRLVEPMDAEAVLGSGSADFVSVGRALYADAYWCQKAFGKVAAPIRKCIACNVCYERLTLEKDVTCVQNPVLGTEFEALEFAEPQLFTHHRDLRKRVLVLGAGVSGAEAARVTAGRGHVVEIWESSNRPGGQIDLATAAPDKMEVEPVWSYRWQELVTVGVPVRAGVVVTADKIREFAPDHVIVATGASPQPAPFDVSRLASSIVVHHAWEILRNPALVRFGAPVTIVGGGMVGLETADQLVTRQCTVTVIEMLKAVAPGMARNNRMELLDRLSAAGVSIHLETRITDAHDKVLEVLGKDGNNHNLACGEVLILANGPKPNREVVATVEAAGVAYTLIGDCSQPGDFLSGLRDAWLVALGIEHLTRHGPMPESATARHV
jgi:2,4-dienoyl-CoA reductase-like NADH-dependent reductase (Old Yellow Enzyme family)/thioredoxin reductase